MQLLLPLPDDGCGHQEQRSCALPREQLAEHQPSLDRLTEADLVGEQVAARIGVDRAASDRELVRETARRRRSRSPTPVPPPRRGATAAKRSTQSRRHALRRGRCAARSGSRATGGLRRCALDELLADRVRQVEDRPPRIRVCRSRAPRTCQPVALPNVPDLCHPRRHDRERLVVAQPAAGGLVVRPDKRDPVALSIGEDPVLGVEVTAWSRRGAAADRDGRVGTPTLISSRPSRTSYASVARRCSAIASCGLERRLREQRRRATAQELRPPSIRADVLVGQAAPRRSAASCRRWRRTRLTPRAATRATD